MENDNEMETYKKEFRNILIFLIPIVLLLFFINKCSNQQLNKCYRITVGEVLDYASDIEGNSSSIIYFNFRKKTYRGYGNGDIGKRYFLKVSCNDPENFRDYEEFFVPDTLQYIPENGWDEIPYGLGDKK